VIPQSKKKKIIESVFKGNVTDLTLSFLEMIVHNKREMYIPDITRRFIYDYKKHESITTVALTTVIPLDQQIKERITQLIRNTYHTTVELEEKQNKQLIGGFIIRIDDMMMDASVSKKLRIMRKTLVTAEYKRK
jgi:F-type H+-transporting ATPase subunit delta